MLIQCNLTVHRIKQGVFSSKAWSSCITYFWKHLKVFVESLMPSEKTQENIRFGENDQIWVLAFHQLFLFILVAGRAVMPRNGSSYLYERRISHHLKTYGPYVIWHGPCHMVHTPEMNFWNEPFKTKRRTCRGSKSWWEDPAYCRMHRFSCWYYWIRQWDGRWCSWPVVQWKFASKNFSLLNLSREYLQKIFHRQKNRLILRSTFLHWLMLLKQITVSYILFYGLFGHGACFNSFFHSLQTRIFRTPTWVLAADSHEQEMMIHIFLQAALKYHQWVINNDSSLISWGLGDCKSSDVSRNSFSSVTIILHFWTEGYKNSNDDIFHCQEFFNNRRLQLQDNFHICTFVLTRGHLVYILKPGIHTLEPVGTRTGRFGTVREKFKNLEKYRTSSHIPVRWSLLETTLEVIPL